MKREPAFPCNNLDGVEAYSGMDLRDWFAGLAMQAILTGQWSRVAIAEEVWSYRDVAIEAYRNADAMLKAREEKNDE